MGKVSRDGTEKNSKFKSETGKISWRKKHRDDKKRKENKLLDELKKKQRIDAGIPDKEPGDIKQEASKGRQYSVSIAVPGSILDNAQSLELRTYLAGQIARAAAIFQVDEIVVFDEAAQLTETEAESLMSATSSSNHRDCNVQMVKILQYLECPQYLRKYLFPLQKDLQYAGILNPLDCLHHFRSDDLTVPYREAVVLNKPTKGDRGSFCNAGLTKEVQVDQQLTPNLRVTIELKTFDLAKKNLRGVVVSPTTPTRQQGYYWGYNVRLARSLNAVFTECPYENGYDIAVGTSDKGKSIDYFEVPRFKHLLIVFGGVKGLEACVENDEQIRGTSEASDLFHFYINACPNQGSRTIRTEEAILITLGALRYRIHTANGGDI